MIQTKFVTLDEFEIYFQIDLRSKLGSEEKALGFLKRIEDRLEAYIDSNYNKNITREYPIFTDYQKAHYKLAILEQAIYIFRNGDLSVDSGFDPERGNIGKGQAVAPNCIEHLRLCGLTYRGVVRWR